MSPATGGARKMQGKVKRELKKTRRKHNTEDFKNHTEHPAYNSENVSCATNEWPDYPDQPRH